MSIPISPASATDLELRGSTGSFAVGGPGGQSIPVQFILTYAGFTETGHYAKLLNYLTPVRELFDLESLDFDELLQRDLDDARISEELIPYVLDARTSSLVRLFPPIVAMMLPFESGTSRPGPLYEPITTKLLPVADQDYQLQVIQSGEDGSEAFRLERPERDQALYFHDSNRLLINTNKTCLAIVDGQHRAMALLALHRNITNGWNDLRRAPYRDFYSHWTQDVLGGFDLKQVSLPMMICFLPELDSGTQHDFNLIKAARSVFLALNKNARRVSVSRNRLLDDNDICAEYLRSILTLIKQPPAAGSHRIRLWNVELDQAHDRTRLESQSAITGVNHLYYIIEHLVARNSDQIELSNRPGRYSTRTKLDEHFKRIGAFDALGQATCEATGRDSYSFDTATELALRI